MIGGDAAKRVATLIGCFDEIVLRRCEAKGELINFHTDFSLRTLQVALNDDYEGGEMTCGRS